MLLAWLVAVMVGRGTSLEQLSAADFDFRFAYFLLFVVEKKLLFWRDAESAMNHCIAMQ